MATDQEAYVACLQQWGYENVSDPTQLGGLTYLVSERDDGGRCVTIGDGGGCPESPPEVKRFCSRGCCCIVCFDADGKYLSHCCSARPVTVGRPVT